MPYDLFATQTATNPGAQTVTHQTPATDTGTIAARAMLARLKISQWGSRKLDKAVTAEVATDKRASVDAGRYNKALLSKDALAAITAAVSAARTYHQERTLPWYDDNYRALPSAGFAAYTAEHRKIKAQFDAAVDAAAASLPDYIDADRTRLGQLFNAADYPSQQEFRDAYSMNLEFQPIPQGVDFRVNMSETERAEIARQIEARTLAALQTAQGDLWRRAADAVRHMAEKLRAYTPTPGGKATGIFRDSLVTNVRELAELLPTLNVAGDPALAALAERLRDDLTGYDAQDLRDSTIARETTARSAEDILASMAGYLGAPE